MRIISRAETAESKELFVFSSMRLELVPSLYVLRRGKGRYALYSTLFLAKKEREIWYVNDRTPKERKKKKKSKLRSIK